MKFNLKNLNIKELAAYFALTLTTVGGIAVNFTQVSYQNLVILDQFSETSAFLGALFALVIAYMLLLKLRFEVEETLQEKTMKLMLVLISLLGWVGLVCFAVEQFASDIVLDTLAESSMFIYFVFAAVGAFIAFVISQYRQFNESVDVKDLVNFGALIIVPSILAILIPGNLIFIIAIYIAYLIGTIVAVAYINLFKDA